MLDPKEHCVALSRESRAISRLGLSSVHIVSHIVERASKAQLMAMHSNENIASHTDADSRYHVIVDSFIYGTKVKMNEYSKNTRALETALHLIWSFQTLAIETTHNVNI